MGCCDVPLKTASSLCVVCDGQLRVFSEQRFCLVWNVVIARVLRRHSSYAVSMLPPLAFAG
jgi:hypothetical protein